MILFHLKLGGQVEREPGGIRNNVLGPQELSLSTAHKWAPERRSYGCSDTGEHLSEAISTEKENITFKLQEAPLSLNYAQTFLLWVWLWTWGKFFLPWNLNIKDLALDLPWGLDIFGWRREVVGIEVYFKLRKMFLSLELTTAMLAQKIQRC